MNESTHCQKVIDQICEYVDGSLNQELCADLERHMSECGDCRIVVNTLRKTIELYQQPETNAMVLPEDVRERLFQCLNLEDYLQK